jgi:hypothetical protein
MKCQSPESGLFVNMGNMGKKSARGLGKNDQIS